MTKGVTPLALDYSVILTQDGTAERHTVSQHDQVHDAIHSAKRRGHRLKIGERSAWIEVREVDERGPDGTRLVGALRVTPEEIVWLWSEATLDGYADILAVLRDRHSLQVGPLEAPGQDPSNPYDQ